MTVEEWSAELKRRHHYEDGMDLVTLEDIRDIQRDAINNSSEEIFGTKGVTPLSNYPGRA